MAETRGRRKKAEEEKPEEQPVEEPEEEEEQPEEELEEEEPEEEPQEESDQGDDQEGAPSLSDKGELSLQIKKDRIEISIPRDGREAETLDRLATLFYGGDD